MEPSKTVFVLQGNPESDVGPQEWWARSIRCTALTAPEAAKTPGINDPAKVAALSTIVGGLGGLGNSERSREERKYRDAVSRMRACMLELVRSGKVAAAALPVILEVERTDLGEKGALARLIEERLSAVIRGAAGAGAGTSTGARADRGGGTGTGSGPARGKKRPRVLPKAPRRIKVVGKRSWMGTAVLRRHMAGMIPQPPWSRTANTEVTNALSLSLRERLQVQLPVLSKSDGPRYQLPPASDDGTGEAPFAPSAVNGREVGRIAAIDCSQDMEAGEGAGSLRVMGGEVGRCMEDTATVARAFIRLHLGWLTLWMGKPPVRDPASANVRIHIVSAAYGKDGKSIGLPMTLALVCWFWDVRMCHDRTACTGEASLCGELSPVKGLREKALGACSILTALVRDEAGKSVLRVMHRACLLVPKENARDGVVVESVNSIDDGATFPVHVPCGVKDRLGVLAVTSLFDAITLMFPRTNPAPSPACPPPRPLNSLAVAKCLSTDNEYGGFCQVIECALLEGGTGKRTYTGNIKKGLSDAIEAGLTWLRRYWDEDVVSNYRGGSIHHRPVDQDYDLHFNLPTSVLEDDPSLACSALVAVLSLLFRRPAPADVVVLAEVRVNGCLWPRERVDDSILLPLAQANGVRKIVTLPSRATGLRSMQQQKQGKFQSIEVVGVSDMVGVMNAVFGTQVIHSDN